METWCWTWKPLSCPCCSPIIRVFRLPQGQRISKEFDCGQARWWGSFYPSFGKRWGQGDRTRWQHFLLFQYRHDREEGWRKSRNKGIGGQDRRWRAGWCSFCLCGKLPAYFPCFEQTCAFFYHFLDLVFFVFYFLLIKTLQAIQFSTISFNNFVIFRYCRWDSWYGTFVERGNASTGIQCHASYAICFAATCPHGQGPSSLWDPVGFCGVVTLEAPVVAKIDEGLGFWCKGWCEASQYNVGVCQRSDECTGNGERPPRIGKRAATRLKALAQVSWFTF